MAAGASDRHVGTGQREFGGRIVIELRALPLHRRVAERTILRETGSHMIWILRVVEIGQVARHAGRGQTSKDVILVAVGACDRPVGTHQRELRGRVVVELRTLPLHRRVAERTILRESGGHMIRILRVVEVRQMA